MIRYVAKRLLMMVPVLLGISFVVLVLINLTPGDPARIMLGSRATDEQVLALRGELGLDDPLPVRYGNFLSDVLHGDFGTSFISKRPVIDDMMERFPYTLKLTALSVVFSVLVGVPLGVFAATHQYTWKDNLAMVVALFCVSMPSFWFALLLIRLFGVQLKWLPISGVAAWTGWVLPCASLAIGIIAIVARQTRSNLLEVIRQDYIVTARAKGLPESIVIYRHALKNAMIPVIMVLGNIFGASLGGAIIAEVIFSIPGIGQYTLTGLFNRDYPVIQGSVLILSALFAAVILVVDVAFAFVDPRIRSQYIGKARRGAGRQA